jgi:hypothetical protein
MVRRKKEKVRKIPGSDASARDSVAIGPTHADSNTAD